MNAFRGIYIMILLSIIFWATAAAILAHTNGHTIIIPACLGIDLGAIWLLIKAARNKNL